MSTSLIDCISTDGVALVTIRRPEKRNAMTRAMCEDLAATWAQFRDSNDRVAVLTGEGGAFCAGADLTDPPPDFWRALPEVGIRIGKPVITAVRGPAVGFGLAMVVFSDLCVAARDANFVYPEARLGISKGLMAGLAVRIPQKLAMEVMLLGEPVTAQRALEAGLVNRVVDVGSELDEAMRMARALTKTAPLVVRMLKTFASDTIPCSPIEALYRAQASVDQVIDSQDASEGLAAFRAKRTPVFRGR